MDYGKEALELFLELKDHKKTATAHNFMGVIYRNQGNYIRAVNSYFKAQEVAEKYDLTEEKAYSYNNIGEIYGKQGRPQEGVEYALKAAESFKSINNKRGEAYAYIRLGELYQELKKFESSRLAFEHSLELRTKSDDEDGIASSLTSLGKLLLDYNENDKAKAHLLRALEISEAQNNTKRLADIETALSKIYIRENNLSKADRSSENGVRYAEQAAARKYLAEALKVRAEVLEKTGKTGKAVLALKRFTKISAELHQEESTKELHLLKSTFESEKKQLEREQKRQQALKAAEDENKFFKRLWLGFIIFMTLLLLLLALLIRSRHRQKIANKNLTEKERTLAARNKKLLEAEAELRKNLDRTELVQAELQDRNSTLEATLKELKATQSQLLQSEKMAMLGQLTANVAHEINTPLAAIRSSAGNIDNALATLMPELPEFLLSTDRKNVDLFLELTALAVKVTDFLSSKERRTIRFKLADEFEERGIKEADSISEMITEMGVHKYRNIYEPLLKLDDAEEFFSMALRLSRLVKSNRNIILATERASKVIFALKSFGRKDSLGEIQNVDINKGLETTLTIYRNSLKQGVEVSTKFDKLPSVKGYSDELIQVWTNIIYNSLQAMNNKGELGIKTEFLKENNSILVSISDSGSGIPEKIRDKIFDPFFTTKKSGEGSGIGLDIVKKIIQKHEGEIRFESETGKGTVFFVKLPAGKV